MNFVLCSDGDRSVIFPAEAKIPAVFDPRGVPVEAPDWLAAKAAYGFELTPLQRELAPLGVEARRVLLRSRRLGT